MSAVVAPDGQGPEKTSNVPDISEVVIRGQRRLVIPDPHPLISARITVALEAGRQAIIADLDTPELVTRALLELCERQQSDDIAYFLKSALKDFIEGVRGILEAAYSLRALNPEIHLQSQLKRNIAGFEHIQANNLMIAVGGVILAEEILDSEVSGWRGQRTQDPLTRLREASRSEIVEHYMRPRIFRGSKAEQVSDRLVKNMLRHLLRSAGAQELVGEEGRLTVELPTRIDPPIEQSVTARRLSGPAQS